MSQRFKTQSQLTSSDDGRIVTASAAEYILKMLGKLGRPIADIGEKELGGIIGSGGIGGHNPGMVEGIQKYWSKYPQYRNFLKENASLGMNGLTGKPETIDYSGTAKNMMNNFQNGAQLNSKNPIKNFINKLGWNPSTFFGQITSLKNFGVNPAEILNIPVSGITEDVGGGVFKIVNMSLEDFVNINAKDPAAFTSRYTIDPTAAGDSINAALGKLAIINSANENAARGIKATKWSVVGLIAALTLHGATTVKNSTPLPDTGTINNTLSTPDPWNSHFGTPSAPSSPMAPTSAPNSSGGSTLAPGTLNYNGYNQGLGNLGQSVNPQPGYYMQNPSQLDPDYTGSAVVHKEYRLAQSTELTATPPPEMQSVINTMLEAPGGQSDIQYMMWILEKAAGEAKQFLSAVNQVNAEATEAKAQLPNQATAGTPPAAASTIGDI